jgi:hypothetical protein
LIGRFRRIANAPASSWACRSVCFYLPLCQSFLIVFVVVFVFFVIPIRILRRSLPHRFDDGGVFEGGICFVDGGKRYLKLPRIAIVEQIQDGYGSARDRPAPSNGHTCPYQRVFILAIRDTILFG